MEIVYGSTPAELAIVQAYPSTTLSVGASTVRQMYKFDLVIVTTSTATFKFQFTRIAVGSNLRRYAGSYFEYAQIA
jgi:hypothetical protein